MKIIGVGNAIVDVICNVNDNFLNANDLTKGTMKLAFDKREFEKFNISTYSKTCLCNTPTK